MYSIIDGLYYKLHENNVSIKIQNSFWMILLAIIGGFLAFRSVSSTTLLDALLSAFFGVAGTYLADYFKIYEFKKQA